MHNNNLKAIQIGAVIYNERSRHSGDIDSIAKCINLVNELIHYSEENLQLLQYHMKNLNLDDRDIPATKKKIANRFIRVIENYILYQKSMKSYYKTLIKKKKNLMKKQNDKNLY